MTQWYIPYKSSAKSIRMQQENQQHIESDMKNSMWKQIENSRHQK